MILPPMLLMIDDYNAPSILSGLTVCETLFELVPKAEVRIYNRGDVIFDALLHKLYSQDAEVLDKSLSCMLSCLAVLERDPKKADHLRLTTRYDQIFEVLLSNVSTSTQIPLRFVLWKNLKFYVPVMGITSARYLQDIFSHMEHDIEVVNDKTLIEILQSLCAVMQATQVRIPNHAARILKFLLQNLLYTVREYPSRKSLKQKVKEESVLCLKMLYDCDSKFVGEILTKISVQETDLAPFFTFIKFESKINQTL
uniref:Uncharacterized protein n=1 Tax=Ciona savignyi TaxID=51511 RepID=H2ZMW4_CIOSA